MRMVGSDPFDIGTGDADIGQFAIAEMRQFPPDGAMALPGVEETGNRCEHGHIPFPGRGYRRQPESLKRI